MNKSIFYFALVAISLCFSFYSHSQVLKTRGSLGVLGDPQGSGNGVDIQQVAPNSTASQMGVLANDKITQINGKKVHSFAELINELSQMRAGDNLKLKVLRSKKVLTLSGNLQSQPKDKSNDFNVVYSSVSSNGNQLRSIIYTPNNLKPNKKYPALYFIQGYTCDSIDWGRVPELTIRQTLAALAKQDYVIYRIEKYGVGDSVGDKNCSQVNFSTELAGFKDGLKQLKGLPYVDASKVHLFGHSLGGLYAPLMALDSEVASISAYGAVVKSWYEYLLDIYSEQAVIFGTDKKQAQNNRKRVQPVIHAIIKTEKNMDEIISDPKLKPVIESGDLPLVGEQFFNRHYTFYRDLNQYNFYDIWSKINVPVLAIHGEYDIQTINEQWTYDIVNSVNQKGKKLAERVVLAKTEHAIMKYSSIDELLKAMRERKHNAGKPGNAYNSDIEKVLSDWLKKNS